MTVIIAFVITFLAGAAAGAILMGLLLTSDKGKEAESDIDGGKMP